jgi:NADH-quinone oxidoreductase subunit M
MNDLMNQLNQIDALNLVTFLPLIGAGAVMLLRIFASEQKNLARNVALAFSLAVGALSIALFVGYATLPQGTSGTASGPFNFVLVRSSEFFPLVGSSWKVGLDGLSATMVLLTGILTPLAILISYEVTDAVHEHMALFLFLEMGLMGLFVSLDLLTFFIFWEIGLVPMYFLINIWGGENRRYASLKFFIYTMAGSLGLLLCIQLISIISGTLDMPTLLNTFPKGQNAAGLAINSVLGIDLGTVKNIAFLAFFLAFAIKVPVWPFHTWLPDAHTEAPTAGSMLLAGVLLKLGAYGFIRLVVPLFPVQAQAFAPVIAVLAAAGIIMGAFAAWGQNDFKRLVAYSSVNHMGFVVMGIAVFAAVYNTILTRATLHDPEVTLRSVTMATNGAVLQMFNHGLSSAGMFLLVGALYHKAHTRDLRRFGGLWNIIPVYGALLVFTSMASLGLPGLNGFVSEYQVVAGSWWIFPTYVGISMLGLLLTGAYILKGIRAVLHGPTNHEWEHYHKEHHSLEIELREVIALAPLAVLMLVTGVYPNWIMPVINQTVTRIFGG